MTRLWLPFGRRILVVIVLLVTLIVLLPMRLAVDALGLEAEGVTARAIRGSVWSARIEGLAVPGVAIGDVRAQLSPLALLVGQARIALNGAGTTPFSGAVVVSRNLLGIEEVTATLPLGAAFQPLPIAAAEVAGLGARFERGACVAAAGTVRVTLSGGLGGTALVQGLSATARCDGRELYLPLASQTGQERLALRVTVDGDWRAELSVATADPERQASLAGLGFERVGAVMRLRLSGRF